MPRVRFTDDFDYRPISRVTIAYRKGTEMTVKRECADKAIKSGKAVAISNRRKAGDGAGTIGG